MLRGIINVIIIILNVCIQLDILLKLFYFVQYTLKNNQFRFGLILPFELCSLSNPMDYYFIPYALKNIQFGLGLILLVSYVAYPNQWITKKYFHNSKLHKVIRLVLHILQCH